MPGETGSTTNAGQVDTNSGLDTSYFDPTLMMNSFVKGEEGNSTTCDKQTNIILYVSGLV